ncbi:HD-GYP domain-containing protein [Sulfurirhabdus autotrophica]|uniref:HD-GYP domain-containing protein (C-di-GMP phosphodiesterase class II) n=1 Tax=Sulfurirhabdus autotrophica TaxID=1706046 RepID=A0A4V2W2Q2_9PROT|nr:HD-GYP domain-containing protein [Sulfurirhabdus autotrophica]TCV88989.1 HD-GYP domain-containing protein (c-di-GMP phosphodiesterase class II) [Sulfurirhabdus autotrophica]
MRKKINVSDLKTGMFVDEFCGSWMDHPFWKSKFKLSEQKDLVTIQKSGVHEVWIDTSKGLDVPAQVKEVSVEEAKQKTDDILLQAVVKKTQEKARVSLDQEMDRAKKIQGKAKQAVMSMFQEARMGKALQLGEATSLVDEINQSVSRNPGALLSLARLKTKDDYTYLHSVAVCALMIALGKHMGIEGDTLKSLGMAGLLHDVGKMAIPDDVLNKPGRLTDQEFDVVKTHPVRGWEVLKASYGVDEIALEVCLHHHEKVDGSGYPDKLSGNDLLLFARMGAVCDVYDAITSNRCYKAGWAPAEALRKMAEWQGHFDPVVFQSFVKTVGIYPTGTLLKLRSGRLGVVTDQSESSLLKPFVKIFFSTRSQAPIAMEILDMSRSQDAIECVEDPAKWGLDLKRVTGI